MGSDVKQITETIKGLERAALDRWNKGDVDGCLEIYAEGVTYSDPVAEARLNGRQTVARYST